MSGATVIFLLPLAIWVVVSIMILAVKCDRMADRIKELERSIAHSESDHVRGSG